MIAMNHVERVAGMVECQIGRIDEVGDLLDLRPGALDPISQVIDTEAEATRIAFARGPASNIGEHRLHALADSGTSVFPQPMPIGWRVRPRMEAAPRTRRAPAMMKAQL